MTLNDLKWLQITSLNLLDTRRLIWSPFRSFRTIQGKRRQNYLYYKHALSFFGTQSDTVSNPISLPKMLSKPNQIMVWKKKHSKWYPDDFKLDFESIQTKSIAKLLERVLFLNFSKLHNFGKLWFLLNDGAKWNRLLYLKIMYT